MKNKMINAQKIVLAIAGLGAVAALGFLAIKSNEQIAKTPPELPVRPIETPLNPIENPVNNSADFGKPVTLRVNEKITFSDGLAVLLKEINDSRCPADVQCIWAGELSGTFALSGGKLSSPKEINLGSTNNKNVTLESYTISLQSATLSSMTIIVNYKKAAPVSQGSCYVGGCSSQICSDQKDMVSTCEYKEEYACYKTSTCKRQASGQCGWTETPELQACLSK